MDDGTYDDLLYRRGFFVSEAGTDVAVPGPVEEWNAVPLDRFVVRTHPDTRYAVADRGDASVVALGRVFDPVAGVAETDAVLETLLDGLTDASGRFFDGLDRLGGRFVLLVETADRAFAVGDATGTRSLFYDDTDARCVLASHPGLIATGGGTSGPRVERGSSTPRRRGFRVSPPPTPRSTC